MLGKVTFLYNAQTPHPLPLLGAIVVVQWNKRLQLCLHVFIPMSSAQISSSGSAKVLWRAHLFVATHLGIVFSPTDCLGWVFWKTTPFKVYCYCVFPLIIRCYVCSHWDNDTGKFWWRVYTTSLTLCHVQIFGNEIETYGKFLYNMYMKICTPQPWCF